ncbi:MAG TPA: hypothetical protein VLI05_02475 [Candidatus Saccharimonadia bacterium]|nr:hypothetical protein [Candidatus Saccharimonadia bacterium]
MDRKLVDKLLTSAGVLVMVMFIIGGALATWGDSFAASQIQSQLTQEKIYFPKAGSPALDPKEFPGLQQYAGTPVDNGDKAKAYADQFIWHHMMKASGGKTYAEVSALAQASPQDPKLAALKATLFQGDMLRSSLLTAYAFSRFGLIAHWSALACYSGAFVMFILVLLGLAHMAAPARVSRRR